MSIFKWFTNNTAKKSKNVAKERLQLVLIHDRANSSPEFIDSLKNDIMEVISKYIEIDESSFNIEMVQTDDDTGAKGRPALVANIPIKKMKDRTRE